MRKANSSTPPLGILIISVIYLMGALMLLVFLVINPGPVARLIAERHGLPSTTGQWILLVMAGLGFILSVGLFMLSRWGYILTVSYLIYFGIVGLVLAKSNPATINFGNFLWSFLVIVYLLIVRKSFFDEGTRHSAHEKEMKRTPH